MTFPIMKTLEIKAPAKVNLALDITGKREDGYHLLETVFQTVSIYDKLKITMTSEPGIKLSCSEPWLPCNEKNLAYKAANAFLHRAEIKNGVRIFLEKKIPSQAGMGGGSSDAAAVLTGMNILCGNIFSRDTLCEMAASLGADVPFFLYGGTAYAEGIGEKLEQLPSLEGIPVVAAKGKGGISTPEAYRRIDTLDNPVHPGTQALREAVKAGEDTDDIWKYCGNIFEQVTELRDVANIRKTMLDMGAVFACMSGSGSAVFGIFRDKNSARICRNKLAQRYPFAVCCETTGKQILHQNNLEENECSKEL
ncbi:MAG: 4-(cytidine 5'-diphospho)-2-C-methyl-D-erythritol kinase [Oscillospiraceae bacterium]|nr:4-(cytidine 5'-diphospho)-2-C-methyl-D-erythritol kinase [Oscillospiraceae bacterium]